MVTASPPAITQVLAGDILIEAEDMIDSHDLLGAPIAIVTCSAASGGLAVDGWDREGEWIDLRLDLTTAACLSEGVRSAGYAQQVREFAIYFKSNPQTTLSSDTLTTVEGTGIG